MAEVVPTGEPATVDQAHKYCEGFNRQQLKELRDWIDERLDSELPADREAREAEEQRSHGDEVGEKQRDKLSHK